MKKSIHTPLDIKAVLYLADHIQEEFFTTSSIISSNEHKEMVVLMESEAEASISKSTVERFFSLRHEPHRISYRSLDKIVKWCFESTYWSFKDFSQKNESEINDKNLLSESQLMAILDGLNKKKSIVSKSQTVEFEGITFTLGEGFTNKLIKEIAIVTGDLLKDQEKRDRTEITSYARQSINDRLTLKENRRQSNIDSIIAKAISYAREIESSDDPVDPDWVVEFFNIAQDCSDENMQYLWARLLANEIAEPNSFSRRTLTSIKILNAYEAQVFSKLCCCIWDLKESHFGREKMLLKDMDINGRYSDETWGFNGSFISHLEEVGLVYDSFLQLDEKRIYNASFFGKEYQLKASKSEQQIDLVALTQVGQEIFRIVNPTPNKEYFQHTLQYFEKINILI